LVLLLPRSTCANFYLITVGSVVSVEAMTISPVATLNLLLVVSSGLLKVAIVNSREAYVFICGMTYDTAITSYLYGSVVRSLKAADLARAIAAAGALYSLSTGLELSNV
jgi:hypothetical protein